MAVLPITPYPPGTQPPPTMTITQFYSAVRLIQLYQNGVVAMNDELHVDSANVGGGDLAPAHFGGVSGSDVALPYKEIMMEIPTNASAKKSGDYGGGGGGDNGSKTSPSSSINQRGNQESGNKVMTTTTAQQRRRSSHTHSSISSQPSQHSSFSSAASGVGVGGNKMKVIIETSSSAAVAVAVVELSTGEKETKEKEKEEVVTEEKINPTEGDNTDQPRRRRSTLSDDLNVIWTRAMKRCSSLSHDASHQFDDDMDGNNMMRRQSSKTFPSSMMMPGVSEEEGEEVVGMAIGKDNRQPILMTTEENAPYDGTEEEYYMSHNECLTYQDTFMRHCTSDVVVVVGGSSAQQQHHGSSNNINRHVYVDAAVTLFGKSGLDNSTIGKLWNVVVLVSDPNNAGGGKLNEDIFILMTHLIVCVTRRGLDVPSTLPMPLRLWRENKMAAQKVLVSPATTASTTTNAAGEVKMNNDGVDTSPRNNPVEAAKRIENAASATSTSASGSNKIGNRSPLESRRIEQMEGDIRSLTALVGTLTTELHGLKRVMERGGGPPPNQGMNRMHNHHGGMNDEHHHQRMDAPPPRTFVPPKAYEIDEDAPNEDVEMYWGNKKDNATTDTTTAKPKKRWRCDAGCDRVFDSYDECLNHERACQGGNAAPPMSSSSPRHVPASERLRQTRQARRQTEQSLRQSRNVPTFHTTSALTTSNLQPQTQMNHSIPQQYQQPRVNRDTVGSGVAKTLMTNGGSLLDNNVAPQQRPQQVQREEIAARSGMREGAMNSYRQGDANKSFRPAKVQKPGILKNKKNGGLDVSEQPEGGGGARLRDISERTESSRDSHYAQSLPVNSQQPDMSMIPQRPPRLMHHSLPAGQARPENVRRLIATRFSDASESVDSGQLPPSRPPQDMHRSMPQSKAAGAVMYDDTSSPGNLTLQMKQIEREEQFDTVLQGAMHRLGSESGSEAGSAYRAAPSPNSSRNKNHLHSSFKPVQLNRNNVKARSKGGAKRGELQGSNLVASARHVYRRPSGTTHIYKTVQKPSTAAIDLPPLV